MQKIEYYLFSGEEICYLREKMGLTKDTLANLLNIPVSRLIRLESGKQEISPGQSKVFVSVLKEHFNYNIRIHCSLDTFLKVVLKKGNSKTLSASCSKP